MTIIHFRKSVGPSPLPRRSFSEGGSLITVLFLIALVCCALSPTVQAVSPAPDGGYANGNTAEGTQALFSVTNGFWNTALGFRALYHTTTGDSNTAEGYQALVTNTTGNENTANGSNALRSNTDGYQNTGNGVDALYTNSIGYQNTATGIYALYNNTTGYRNMANGVSALFSNTTGANNAATGGRALLKNTTGSNNIALGFNAGGNLTTGSNNIDIGNVGVAAEAQTIRIGVQGTQTRAFIAGINGATASGGVAVYANSSGQLGTLTSSARFKQNIKTMSNASDVLLALHPVTFRYKPEIDPKGLPQFGLVAEEVEKVNPDLIVRDAEGKPYTVRYEAVNAMLLNEFLKEHRKVQEQEATITQLKSTVAQQQKGMEVLTAAVKEQGAQIQKVNEKVELNKPAPRTVINNQ